MNFKLPDIDIAKLKEIKANLQTSISDIHTNFGADVKTGSDVYALFSLQKTTEDGTVAQSKSWLGPHSSMDQLKISLAQYIDLLPSDTTCGNIVYTHSIEADEAD